MQIFWKTSFTNYSIKRIMLHSHQIKIATDWLQTSFRLASDSKIGVNGTMLYQCNPTVFTSLELV